MLDLLIKGGTVVSPEASIVADVRAGSGLRLYFKG